APSANPLVARNQSRRDSTRSAASDAGLSERITYPDGSRPAREQLIAIEVAIQRLLNKRIELKILRDADCYARRQVDDRTCCVGGVGKCPLVRALVSHIDLKLRNNSGIRLVAQSHAHRREVAGAVVGTGFIQILHDGRLKLP